jgi:hypothetical protein
MKFVDIQGRVEKFQAKMKQAKSWKENKKDKKQAKAAGPQKSLKEMLQDLKTNQETPAPIKA